jgi:class 3 adenylate cyclase/tetratricopeptide (TPR) repeat protein
MRCAKCGNESTTGRKFCATCGSPLSSRCQKCGAENAPSSAFCEDCGNALAGHTASVAASSPQAATTAPNICVTREQPAGDPLEGERKTVTALFTDIKGSTELMEDLDPEEARAIIDPELKLMIDAVRRYDGYVVQSTGDGIFALFGAPVAHEDHSQLALYAALRMQEDLKRYSARLREAGNLPIEARVGANTGEVVVRSITTGEGQTEYTPIGHTTNLASRMQALAPTGSIAISEQTRRFVEGYFQLKPLGPTRVKGVSEPVDVYEVTGLGPLRTRLQRSAGRGLTKFVGREREMEALKHGAEQAKSAGHGQIVAAMAEAGTGKSRLYFEFKATSATGWMVLETFSVSHGKASAYLPVIELLWNYFKIIYEDDERTRREKVTGRVLALERTLEDTLPYLFSLLGIVEGDDLLAQMDGQIKKRRTLEAIKRIVLRESLNQPLMVIFEDLHWIDEETQALLNLLADSIGTAKVLLLVNYRPEYSHHWNSKTYYTQLRLDTLGKEGADEMLTALIGDGPEVRPLKRLIIERTGGNPFFMEETVQVLLDEGALVRDGTAVRLTRPLSELKVPPTVQDILAARIDRLPTDEKDLLQTLAVLGKEFTLSHLKATAVESDAAMEQMIANLQLAEFIYEQPATGDIEFTFKHALTQEVAYNSILAARRKVLHERAAVALERLYAGRLDDHASELARHFHASGNYPKAVEYLRLAGELAAKRSAHDQAIALLNSALELLVHLPDGLERMRTELEVRLALTACVAAHSGYASPELAQVNRGTLELSSRLGDPRLHFPALMFEWAFHQIRRDLGRARVTTDKLMRLADQVQEPGMIVHANYASGAIFLFRGELGSAVERLERARKVYQPQPLRYEPQDTGVTARSFLALALWISGYPARALSTSEETLNLARQLGQPLSLAIALTYRTLLHLCRREHQLALEVAEKTRRLALEGGFEFWASVSSAYHGIARAALGESEEGISEILKAIGRYRATGSELGAALIMVGVASSYLQASRLDQALAAVAQALATNERTTAQLSEAELYRLRGRAQSAKGADFEDQARANFERAIEIARRQSAKSFELRDHESVAVARNARPSRRSAHDARRNLQLVHRGLRHRRSGGRQGIAGRASGLAGNAVRKM